MSDKELLEAAARAAGLTGYIEEWTCGPYFVVPADPSEPYSEPTFYRWLQDDGDALRLARACGLRVEFWLNQPMQIGGKVDYGDGCYLFGVENGAWRGAITRAAAMIGGYRE